MHLVARREGQFERHYAMKRLHRHLLGDDAFRTMFMEEARIAGLVRHPGVVSVLDVGEDEDGPFLVMDFVLGISGGELLKRLATQDLRLPVQIGLRLAQSAARGLHAAHELRDASGRSLGLVHRDISPQNILIGFDGVVRVTDFGVAKALDGSTRTETGIIKGKFGYLAPERLQYEEADRRSDIYALGVVLFELLAGRRLHPRRDGPEGLRRVLEGPPPDIGDEREDVDDDLVELLFAMLARRPDGRPATAKDVADALDAMIGDRVLLEGRLDVGPWVAEHFADLQGERERLLREAPRTPSQQAPRRPWMGRALVIAASLGLAVAAGGLGYLLAPRESAASAEPVAPPAAVGAPPTVEAQTATAPPSPPEPAPVETAVEPMEGETPAPRRRRRRRARARPVDSNATPDPRPASGQGELPSWEWQ